MTSRSSRTAAATAWQTNLVVFYVPKNDASERVLFDKLGLESLITPITFHNDPPLPARNSNERNRAPFDPQFHYDCDIPAGRPGRVGPPRPGGAGPP